MNTNMGRQLPLPAPIYAPVWGAEPDAGARDSGALDMRKWWAALRRRSWVLMLATLLVLAAAAAYTHAQTPLYSATTAVMLNVQREQITDAPQVLQGDPENRDRNASLVDTEAELLRSGRLAPRVVDALKLDRDPEFNTALAEAGPLTPALVTTLATQNRKAVIAQVKGALAASRVGTTYILQISFTSQDPIKAARIANAFAQFYLAEQGETKVLATRQANDWLSTRLNELKSQVQAADAAVAQYRIEHNLMNASGQSLTEQELSNYNIQSTEARAALAAAEAKLGTARQQLARGARGDNLGEALNSVVIQNLRSQRAMVSARRADLQTRYGPKMPEMIKADQELADIDAQIREEVGRVVANLETEVETARRRAQSLQDSVGRAEGALANNNRANVTLGELQRNADAVRSLYEGFLTRYRQTSAQQDIATPDARVVTPAVAPTKASSPSWPINLAVGVALGLALGVALIVALELMDTSLSTAEDVQQRLILPYLGSIPALESLSNRGGSPTRHVVTSPLSAFSESFRSLAATLLYSHAEDGLRTAVITSALPGEGKSVVSVCLTRSLSLQGHRTIMVDCDLRRGAGTRVGGGAPRFGLLEVLSGEATLAQATLRDPESGAHFLPLAAPVTTPEDIFGLPEMDDLLAKLREEYELVILDTGPVLAAAESRVLARKADTVIFLAAWRRTPQKAIEAALQLLEGVGAKIAGVALTRVDMRLQVKSGYGDPSFYYPRYAKYFRP